MRESHSHLAVVTQEEQVIGLITLDDVLRRLFPRPTAPRRPGHLPAGERRSAVVRR